MIKAAIMQAYIACKRNHGGIPYLFHDEGTYKAIHDDANVIGNALDITVNSDEGVDTISFPESDLIFNLQCLHRRKVQVGVVEEKKREEFIKQLIEDNPPKAFEDDSEDAPEEDAPIIPEEVTPAEPVEESENEEPEEAAPIEEAAPVEPEPVPEPKPKREKPSIDPHDPSNQEPEQTEEQPVTPDENGDIEIEEPSEDGDEDDDDEEDFFDDDIDAEIEESDKTIEDAEEPGNDGTDESEEPSEDEQEQEDEQPSEPEPQPTPEEPKEEPQPEPTPEEQDESDMPEWVAWIPSDEHNDEQHLYAHIFKPLIKHMQPKDATMYFENAKSGNFTLSTSLYLKAVKKLVTLYFYKDNATGKCGAQMFHNGQTDEYSWEEAVRILDILHSTNK